MLTIEEINKFFTYNPNTGIIINKINRGVAKKGDQAGSVDSKGYLRIRRKQKFYSMHRIAWVLHYGDWPKGQIDHINGNRQDNRIKNLRVVTQKINNRNIQLSSRNRTGIFGVRWKPKDKAYHVYIGTGVDTYLGQTKDFFEACCIRKAAELQYQYHPNHGRTK